MKPDWPKLCGYPEVAEAEAKLHRLRGQLAEVVEQISHGQQRATAPQSTAKVDAAALLDSGELPRSDTPKNEDLALLCRQRRALHEAITQQERIVREAISTAGYDAAHRLEGEYIARVNRLHEAYSEVLAANDAVRDLLEYLHLQGFEYVTGVLHPMQLTRLPRATDTEQDGSFWPGWEKEAREHGYID
jgi:hypothetical protein